MSETNAELARKWLDVFCGQEGAWAEDPVYASLTALLDSVAEQARREALREAAAACRAHEASDLRAIDKGHEWMRHVADGSLSCVEEIEGLIGESPGSAECCGHESLVAALESECQRLRSTLATAPRAEGGGG